MTNPVQTNVVPSVDQGTLVNVHASLLTTGLKQKHHKWVTWKKIDFGRAAPFASPIRFETLGLLHDPYTLPAGSPIDP